MYNIYKYILIAFVVLIVIIIVILKRIYRYHEFYCPSCGATVKYQHITECNCPDCGSPMEERDGKWQNYDGDYSNHPWV